MLVPFLIPESVSNTKRLCINQTKDETAEQDKLFLFSICLHTHHFLSDSDVRITIATSSLSETDKVFRKVYKNLPQNSLCPVTNTIFLLSEGIFFFKFSISKCE
jgi:hypothetical protein